MQVTNPNPAKDIVTNRYFSRPLTSNHDLHTGPDSTLTPNHNKTTTLSAYKAGLAD